MDENHRRQALDSLRSTPERLVDLLSRAGSRGMDSKPSPMVFSLRENVHHLRDLEIEGFGVRLTRLLHENEPLLPGIDGDALARERAYNERPHEGALEEFRRAREESLAILERLTADEWQREGTLESLGKVSVEGLVELWSRHDQDHVEQVRRLVSEGEPTGGADFDAS